MKFMEVTFLFYFVVVQYVCSNKKRNLKLDIYYIKLWLFYKLGIIFTG